MTDRNLEALALFGAAVMVVSIAGMCYLLACAILGAN